MTFSCKPFLFPLVVGVALSLMLASCAGTIGRRQTPPARPQAMQGGRASWYGPGFYGRRTASGEIYSGRDLTAAHRILPLGSRAVVTNLDSGKSVEVRINDRGPFVRGRIIDLSPAAARAIGLIQPGTAPVRVETIPHHRSSGIRYRKSPKQKSLTKREKRVVPIKTGGISSLYESHKRSPHEHSDRTLPPPEESGKKSNEGTIF